MIRASVERSLAPVKPFPKLMAAGAHIVLFSEPHVGCTVYPVSGYPIGYQSESWCMILFKDYNSEVKLIND